MQRSELSCELLELSLLLKPGLISSCEVLDDGLKRNKWTRYSTVLVCWFEIAITVFTLSSMYWRTSEIPMTIRWNNETGEAEDQAAANLLKIAGQCFV